MIKLSNQISFILFILAVVMFVSCSKENPEQNYLAKVDDSYLTDSELAKDIDTNNIQQSRKSEFIRNWVDTEVLYKEALDKNIDNEEEYVRITQKAKKELAKSFLIQKFFDEHPVEFKPQDLIDYYESRKATFKLFFDTYLYNALSFDDEDKAILFRSTLIESDWNRATNVFRGDESIKSENANLLLYDYQIQPYSLCLVIQELQPGEASIVLNLEPNRYTVVQLIKKYTKDEIPEFEIIKDKVEERYLTFKKQEMLKEYLNALYAKYKVKIK